MFCKAVSGSHAAMTDILDFISNTADGVVGVDRGQKVVLWNPAAEMLLGFKRREVLGRFCYEVIGGRDGSGAPVCHMGCPDLVMAHKQEPIFTRDLMVRTKLGREIWVSVSTVLVPSRWKDLCVLVHLFRDVSYQKALEQSVKQLLATMAKLAVPRETDSPTGFPASVPPAKLTRREQEVLRLLTSGASTKAIAIELFISPSTVRNHVHNILAKLGVHSRLAAVTRSLRNGLI